MTRRDQALQCIRNLIGRKFVRFLLVGGVNTLFGYGIYAFLLFLGLSYPLAALFSTLLGVLFNFKTIGAFVFKSRSNALIFRFLLVYLAVYAVNLSGLRIFSGLHWNSYASGAVLVLPLACFSFLLNRAFVFRHPKEPKDENGTLQ